MIVPPDIFLTTKMQAIISLAAQYRLPAVYAVSAYANSGGLIAYGPDFSDNYRRAAKLVDRILNGARPAELPVEQPNKFRMAINLKTAKALGLTVPAMLFAQADEVINNDAVCCCMSPFMADIVKSRKSKTTKISRKLIFDFKLASL